MARKPNDEIELTGPFRLMVVGLTVFAMLALFVFWRIDGPRAEAVRARVTDAFAPALQWGAAPITWVGAIARDFQSYARLYEQNEQLREELRQMKAWKEAALQLEQKNARLLDLNKVRLDPKLTHLTGVVLADSGSPFRQSVLINAGARDGVREGWAAMDGIGLVGRIAGVGEKTARVLLLTDNNSRVPVTLQPSGQKAILSGDNSALPPLDFVEDPSAIAAGDLVVSSGDGGIFPAGIVVGKVVLAEGKRLRVRLEADMARLEFLRILRSHELDPITSAGALLAMPPMQGPAAPTAADLRASGASDQPGAGQ
ncbi:MAG: rod shape-determining protein MreC [Cypionkella sp.]|nr:rod shape-determining protein MreC [Cypionkella sp.]